MSLLIYGAYGYTGRLITREAVDRGHQPVLAGRSASHLDVWGREMELPTRRVALEEPLRLRAILEDVSAVLHCAGPYVATATPMVGACLQTGTHYLDITGERDVFEQMIRWGTEAETADVVLLPGVGFDVVPTDCLARYVSTQVSSPSTLEIALLTQGGVSRGTLKTVIEQMGRGGLVRREGKLREVPQGWTTRTVNFGDRPRTVISIPDGCVVTAGYSTNVPNVTAYAALPWLARRLLRASHYVSGLLGWNPLKQVLHRIVESRARGPSREERQRGRTVVWAAAREKGKRPVAARLRGPDAYTFTARAAVTAAERVLQGDVPPGYQTPSTAFGPDFAVDLQGVEREEGEPA